MNEAFKQVAEYLTLVGRNGIVMNPEKFVFGKDEVDWAGVRIANNGVKPLVEHVDAIRNFPVLENITDMRSNWALVNKVSNYYATQHHSERF